MADIRSITDPISAPPAAEPPAASDLGGALAALERGDIAEAHRLIRCAHLTFASQAKLIAEADAKTEERVAARVRARVAAIDDCGDVGTEDACTECRGCLRAARDGYLVALDRVRAAVIECAYCNGAGCLVRLPGDVLEACPACGGLREALRGVVPAAQVAPAAEQDAVPLPVAREMAGPMTIGVSGEDEGDR